MEGVSDHLRSLNGGPKPSPSKPPRGGVTGSLGSTLSFSRSSPSAVLGVGKLMKSLGVIHDDACIFSDALDKHASVFCNPVPEIQIKALAALFGWSLPEEQPEA
jgi:hypothetical protein